jgi:hypothetical protein
MPTPIPAGLLYPANASGKSYLALYYHRGTPTRQKSTWHDAIPPDEEHSIFCNADHGGWSDDNGHFWGIRNDGYDVLGSQGERLCKFPLNENLLNPWHGYPTSPLLRGDHDSPSIPFVQAWIDGGVVSRTTGRRIQRQKI